MYYPRCSQCQQIINTKDEISQKLCTQCAQKMAEATPPASTPSPTLFCAFPTPCPWEDEAGFCYRRFWLTCKEIIMHPDQFFQHLARIPDTTSPLSFTYLASAHALLLLALISFPLQLIPSLPFLIIGTLGLMGLVTAWFLLVPISLYATSFIYHLGIRLQGQKRKFHQTLRVIGYANALQVFETMPVINIIAIIWHLVVVAKGLKHVHQLSTGQAILAMILIPLLFTMIIGTPIIIYLLR